MSYFLGFSGWLGMSSQTPPLSLENSTENKPEQEQKENEVDHPSENSFLFFDLDELHENIRTINVSVPLVKASLIEDIEDSKEITLREKLFCLNSKSASERTSKDEEERKAIQEQLFQCHVAPGADSSLPIENFEGHLEKIEQLFFNPISTSPFPEIAPDQFHKACLLSVKIAKKFLSDFVMKLPLYENAPLYSVMHFAGQQLLSKAGVPFFYVFWEAFLRKNNILNCIEYLKDATIISENVHYFPCKSQILQLIEKSIERIHQKTNGYCASKVEKETYDSMLPLWNILGEVSYEVLSDRRFRTLVLMQVLKQNFSQLLAPPLFNEQYKNIALSCVDLGRQIMSHFFSDSKHKDIHRLWDSKTPFSDYVSLFLARVFYYVHASLENSPQTFLDKCYRLFWDAENKSFFSEWPDLEFDRLKQETVKALNELLILFFEKENSKHDPNQDISECLKLLCPLLAEEFYSLLIGIFLPKSNQLPPK